MCIASFLLLTVSCKGDLDIGLIMVCKLTAWHFAAPVSKTWIAYGRSSWLVSDLSKPQLRALFCG